MLILVYLDSQSDVPNFDRVAVISYASAALYGTLSLWIVAFRGLSIFVVVGLVLGVVVISPFTYGVVTSPYPLKFESLTYAIYMVAPPIVAMFWITKSVWEGLFFREEA